MSHFTRLKTKLVEQEFLLEALRDLGFACEVGSFRIRDFNGKQAAVEIKLKDRPIGFHKEGGTYEIVADWYGHKAEQKALLANLSQRYAYHAALAKLTAQGFALAGESKEGEQLHLTLRRMV